MYVTENLCFKVAVTSIAQNSEKAAGQANVTKTGDSMLLTSGYNIHWLNFSHMGWFGYWITTSEETTKSV